MEKESCDPWNASFLWVCIKPEAEKVYNQHCYTCYLYLVVLDFVKQAKRKKAWLWWILFTVYPRNGQLFSLFPIRFVYTSVHQRSQVQNLSWSRSCVWETMPCTQTALIKKKCNIVSNRSTVKDIICKNVTQALK